MVEKEDEEQWCLQCLRGDARKVRTGIQELPPCCMAMMPNEDMGNPLLSISWCPLSLNAKGNVSLWCSTQDSGGS